MLLAADIGNTNIVFGLHDGGGWVGRWRMRTDRAITEDELASSIQGLIGLAGFELNQIGELALASVVPPLTATMTAFGRQHLNLEPLVVEAAVAGMAIDYENPKSLGADRIANAVAAFDCFARALIVVDFGTATTLDYITPEGRFAGGVIAPGLLVTGEALFARTAQLPQVDVLKEVKNVVAQDTVSAMIVGLHHGYVGLVRGLLAKIKAEVKTDPLVVATGGLASVLAAHGLFEVVEPNLTLEGVRLILKRNRPPAGQEA